VGSHVLCTLQYCGSYVETEVHSGAARAGQLESGDDGQGSMGMKGGFHGHEGGFHGHEGEGVHGDEGGGPT